MELKFETEKKENAEVLLTMTIGKNEVQNKYKKVLADTQKNIVMNGFRKGKVPVSILEVKFKKDLLNESAHSLIDEAYKEVLGKLDVKPLGSSSPSLEDIGEISLDKDLVVKISYETFPEIKFGEYKNVEVEKEEIVVSDEDVKEEVGKYLGEFSTIESKDDVIENGDIALVEYKVFEDGVEVDSKATEYVHVGKEYDKYKLGNDLVGLKKGAEKEISKIYSKDAIAALAGKTFAIKLKINDVKYEKKPELTDELAKQIDKEVDSADAFVKKIHDNMITYALDLTKQKLVDKIMDKILETFDGVIPVSMMNAQLDSYYTEILQRVGGDEKKAQSMLKLEGFTKESYLESMRDKAEKVIKKSLIMNDIVKKEKIEASEDEIKEFFDKFVKSYQINSEDLFENYKKNGQLNIFEEDVKLEKATELIYNSAKIKSTKKVFIREIKN